jgi:ATP-binding cassette, subfamily B (MDR/TAP), member 1
VHFNYPTRPDNKILKGLNLTIEEGKTTALVGPR